jgi:hypothetical protein
MVPPVVGRGQVLCVGHHTCQAGLLHEGGGDLLHGQPGHIVDQLLLGAHVHLQARRTGWGHVRGFQLLLDLRPGIGFPLSATLSRQSIATPQSPLRGKVGAERGIGEESMRNMRESHLTLSACRLAGAKRRVVLPQRQGEDLLLRRAAL